jgi:hypothetical protein
LESFDKVAPKYERPKRLSAVKKWFNKAGLRNIEIIYNPNGFNVVAREIKL